MRFEMKMPDLSTNESDVRIVRWIVEPGQTIERGRPLLEVETDKATMEVESAVTGVLQEVRSHVDEAVSVGQVIAVLEVDAAPPTSGVFPAAVSHEAAQATESVPLLRRNSAGGAMGMFARNRAAASLTPIASAVDIPLTLPQRIAAKRLQESKQTIPHFYLQTSVNAAAMIARRKEAKPVIKLAWDAFFVLAAAKALAKFDRFRCRLDGERLTPAATDAIGVAVDVEGELYVTPIASPAAKTLERISEEIRHGVDLLRGGDVEARRIRPALITITNLGVCNVESFIPIINPPEPAILGIGKAVPTPVAQDDGRIGVEHRCKLTLCVDHRVCSGKYAGDFLEAIVQELESFS